MGMIYLTAPRTDDDVRIGTGIWKFLKKHTQPHLSSTAMNVRVKMPFKGKEDLQLGLDALTAWNVAAMKQRPIPFIYESGVRYRREILCVHDGVPKVCEEWLTAHEILRRSLGADCEDLGCYLAASLIMKGEQARAVAKRSAVGWHIQTRRADGSIEDPSAKLGMPTS